MDSKVGYGFDIDEVYQKHVEKLDNIYQVYKEAENNPELILTDMYKGDTIYQSYYTLMTDVLKHGDIGVHEFKESLARVMHQYFKGIDEDVLLKTSRGGYPNYYYLEYEGKELLRFSIFKHLYEVKGVGERIRRIKKEIEVKDKEIRKIEYDLEEFKGYLERPRTLIKKESNLNIRERIQEVWLLMTKRGKIMYNLERQIWEWEERLVDVIKSKQDKEEQLNSLENKKKSIETKEKEWVDRFVGWGYQKGKGVYS